ncbi:MAG: hypothetical protein ACKOEY_00165 [Phenylobacterium sp.]
MPNKQASKPSEPLNDIADWMRHRGEAVAARMSPQARALGHELFRAAIRSGAAIPLATPMAVALAGAQALVQDRRRTSSPASRPQKVAAPLPRAAPPQRKPATAVVARQPAQPLVSSLAAGARGASDAFTFGLGDHLGAGISAAGGAIQGRDFMSDYQEGMASAQAQDEEDWRLHPYARAAGGIAGTGASLVVASPLALGRVAAGGVRMAALADAPRLKAAAGLVGREVAGLTGLGALNGATGQAVLDQVLGRNSPLSDYAGAAFGGATGTAALLATLRPQASAALGGAITSVSQDLLAGRPISFDEALQSAGLSGATSGLVAPLVSTRVNRLRPSEKGKLGERLSEGRSHLRGDAPREGAKPRVPVGGGKVAIPDHQTQSGRYVEAKFGPSARLSDNQTKAFSLDLDGFRLDHFLPQDVGAATAAIASNLAMTASRPRAKTDGSSPQNRHNRSRGR